MGKNFVLAVVLIMSLETTQAITSVSMNGADFQVNVSSVKILVTKTITRKETVIMDGIEYTYSTPLELRFSKQIPSESFLPLSQGEGVENSMDLKISEFITGLSNDLCSRNYDDLKIEQSDLVEFVPVVANKNQAETNINPKQINRAAPDEIIIQGTLQKGQQTQPLQFPVICKKN